MTRWYRCPSTIHHFNLTTPDTCWRCLSSRGTMLHIWWECPPIQKFWQQIFLLYCKLMATALSPTPEIALLSMLPGTLKSIKKDVLRHFLAAARMVIPKYWKSRTVYLPLGEWAIEVDRIRDLERLLAEESNKDNQFSLTWTSWSMFHYSSDSISWAEGKIDSTTS